MIEVRLAVLAMRVRFELVLQGTDHAALQAAGEEAMEEIRRVESLLHPFDPSSELFRINAEAGRKPVRISGAMRSFLVCASALARATDGAFDLTATSGGRGFSLDEETDTVMLIKEHTRLDPGALGKGWALERAAELLREAGVTRTLLHGGTSSVVAIGSPEGEAGWKVAVCDPADSTRQIELFLLRDESLSVSSSVERPHVVDPRTGKPVEEARLAVVRTASATEAEALSTALLVLGREAIPHLKRNFPNAALSLYS